MNNVVVSFFKHHEIPYSIEKNKKFINFVCFYCQADTRISSIRCKWKCIECGQEGTLIHLIKFLEREDKTSIDTIKRTVIYDEKKEIDKIKKLLSNLGSDPTVIELKEKVLNVLEKQKRHLP